VKGTARKNARRPSLKTAAMAEESRSSAISVTELRGEERRETIRESQKMCSSSRRRST
jgi:hypothetical protein